MMTTRDRAAQTFATASQVASITADGVCVPTLRSRVSTTARSAPNVFPRFEPRDRQIDAGVVPIRLALAPPLVSVSPTHALSLTTPKRHFI